MRDFDLVLLTWIAILLLNSIYLLFSDSGAANKSKSAVKMRHPRDIPVYRKDYTAENLKKRLESEGKILIAIDGLVFDCSKSTHLYGKGGPYEVMAGKDASIMLAKGVTDDSVVIQSSLADLSRAESAELQRWKDHFKSKYTIVGEFINK